MIGSCISDGSSDVSVPPGEATCLVLPLAQAGDVSLTAGVAAVLDCAFKFYASSGPRCPHCLGRLDTLFASWHARACALGVLLGPVYRSLCDGAYFKTLDHQFRRRNGWARKTIVTAVALWPLPPCAEGTLCQQVGVAGLSDEFTPCVTALSSGESAAISRSFKGLPK